MSRRKNIYPANPYPPGTLLAAQWDVKESVRRLGGVTMAEAKRLLGRRSKRKGEKPE